jgi:FSR family fosmidomycin resistance protein-like MFS transporter
MHIKRLISISFGHFSIDILNSSVPMILTVLSPRFDLSISQIGLAAMIYQFAAALTQPLFGLLADRLRGRWMGAVGVLWTAFFFGLAAFASSYPILVLLMTIGALGSGAFHPVGILNSGTAGGRYATTATSFFFLSGQTGLAVGPWVAGVILQYMGVAGLPYMALAMLPAVGMMVLYLSQPIVGETSPTASKSTHEVANSTTSPQGIALLVIVAFVLVIALRSTATEGLRTLLPKFYADQGMQPADYGRLLFFFSFASALGTFVGGYLGDHFNRRLVIFVSMAFGVPFAFIMLYSQGWLFYLSAILGGALLNIPHAILLVIGQQLLPKRKGMIGGAVLGFMFAVGAATTWIASWFADWVGLATVLSVIAFIPLGAGISALFLPSTRPPQPLGAPASAPAGD